MTPATVEENCPMMINIESVIDRLTEISRSMDPIGSAKKYRAQLEDIVSKSEEAYNNPDFDVQKAVREIVRDYIKRALHREHTLSDAAHLLGLSNYQTLKNWMEKYDIEKPKRAERRRANRRESS